MKRITFSGLARTSRAVLASAAAAALLVTMLPQAALAAATAQIPFNGVLRTSGGAAVTSATDLRVCIFDDAALNVAPHEVYAYNGSQTAPCSGSDLVTVIPNAAGEFSLLLGSGTNPLPTLDTTTKQYWIEFTVGTDAPLTRIQLGNALGAETVNATGPANVTGALTVSGATTAAAITASGLVTANAGATVTGGAANINVAGTNTTNINSTSGVSAVNIGNDSSTTTVLGVTNINATGTQATNIATGGASAVNIGNALSTATLLGVANINTAGTAATTIGNAGSATTIGGTLGIAGATTATGALYADGGVDRSSGAQLDIGGSFANAVHIKPNTTIDGTLTVTGAITGSLTGNASTATSATSATTATTATKATNIANGVAGAIPYQSAANTTGLTAAGTSGQFLTSGGAGAPSWTTLAVTSADITDGTIANVDLAGSIAASKLIGSDITTVGTIGTGTWHGTAIADAYIASAATWNGKMTNPMTTAGDIIYSSDGSGTPARLAIGAAGTVLKGGVTPSWSAIATADIADGAITSAKILDGTIATADIADGAITSAKILDGTIADADISGTAGIAVSKLAALTASRALVTDGSGVITPATTTATEIGYVNGVTSSIQTQLDAKAPLVSPSFTTPTLGAATATSIDNSGFGLTLGANTSGMTIGKAEATVTFPGNVTISGTFSPAVTAFSDSAFRVQDNADATKQLAFEVSGITTGTTRTVTLPDVSGTMTVLGNTVTGSGSIALATSPALTTPDIGVATAASVNKVAITAPAGGATLTIADGKTLTADNSITIAGTDAKTLNIGSNNLTFTTTGDTGVTLPTTGTLATLDGSETLTGKTLTSPILTTPTVNGITFENGADTAIANAVTLNKSSGIITSSTSNLAAATTETITLNDTRIGVGSIILATIADPGTGGQVAVLSAKVTGAGAASITVRNVAAAAPMTSAYAIGFLVVN